MALYAAYIKGACILCFSLFLSCVSVFEIFARNLKHFFLKNKQTNKTNYVRSKLLPDKWFIVPTSLWKTTKQMGESLKDLWFTMLPTPSTVLALKCKAWAEIWNISLLPTSPLFSPQKFHEETNTFAGAREMLIAWKRTYAYFSLHYPFPKVCRHILL